MKMIQQYTHKKQLELTHQCLKLTWTLCLVVLISGCQEQGSSTDHETNLKPAESVRQTASLSKTPSIPTDTFTILALGDSLTEGLGVNKNSNYPALLEQALHQQGFSQVKVINSGLSGETSSGLKARLDWALQLKPNLTLLNIGANDAIRGLPLDLTSQNIDEIIKRIQASDSTVVLAGMQIYDNLGQEYVTGFKDMYPKLAEQNDLVIIPFFLEHVGGDPKLNQADMIHPTTEGYEVIVKHNVLPTVLPLLKQMIKPIK